MSDWDVVTTQPARSYAQIIAENFPGDAATTAVKVMQAESSGDPGAVNKNTNRTVDHGLFQINDVNVPALIKAGIIKSKADLYIPEINIKAAGYLHNQEGFKPWKSSEDKWGDKAANDEWGVVSTKPTETQTPTLIKTLAGFKKPTPEDTVPEWGKKNPNLYGVAGAGYETLSPLLQALGLGGGALLGTPAGPAGQVAGAGMGYAAANRLKQMMGNLLNVAPSETIPGGFKQAGKDVVSGAAMEAGGQSVVPAIGAIAKPVGNILKSFLGMQSGTGKAAMDEIVSGSKEAIRGMRGGTSGDAVIADLRDAMQQVKGARASDYQTSLAKVSQETGKIDTNLISNKIVDLMKRFNVKVARDGTLDTSRIAMGKAGRKDIEEIIGTVQAWGNHPGDNTATGLDVLKRQLDDFYSDSSQARAFVTDLKKTVSDTITKNVPEYGKMTKGYSDATIFIKDLESSMMSRKQGMSGRIVADQTLKRLVRVMRQDTDLGRDMLNVLGEKTSKDLTGQVAGQLLNDWMPKGLMGKVMGGEAIYLTYLNPKFWPLLAASSPRVVGEFLNVFGKGLRAVKAVTPVIPAAVKATAIQANQQQLETKKWKSIGEE